MKSNTITIMCLIMYSTGEAGRSFNSINSLLHRTTLRQLPNSPAMKADILPKDVSQYPASLERDMDHNMRTEPTCEIPQQRDPIHFRFSTEYVDNNEVKRNKRELTEETNQEESPEESLEAESLPEAESLTWVRPTRFVNPGLVRNINNFPHNPSQTTYQNRQAQRRIDPTSSLSYGHNSQIPNHPNLNRILNSMYDDEYASNSHGGSHGINTISRQYLQNEYLNSLSYPPGSRYRDLPLQNQQGYSVPSYPPRGSSGSSLLDFLNPLNLFRQPISPNLPRNPNPIPPLDYDPRHLSQTPKQPPQNTQNTLNNGNVRIPYRGNNKNEFANIIDYEIVEEDIEHDYGHEYYKDSDLRDDIYIGKDGNFYIKESPPPKKGDANKQNQYGDARRPSKRPSYTKPDRPGIAPPRERFESDRPEGMEIYEDLLKNHNMNEEHPFGIATSDEDFFGDNFDNYQTNSIGNLLDYDSEPNSISSIEYEDYEEDFGQFQNSRIRPSRPQSSENWRPTNSRKINYPSYFYTPKQVTFNSLQNRPRAWRPMPPRSGRPRPPPMNPLRTSRPIHSRPTPKLTLPPKLSQGYTNIPYLTSTDYSYKDRRKNTRTQTPSLIDSGRIQNGDGFYPGNGFFNADFPTLFHMGSSMRHRTYHGMPSALAQNGTTLSQLQNSTTIIPYNMFTTVEDSPS